MKKMEAELKRLRRENEVLWRKREILENRLPASPARLGARFGREKGQRVDCPSVQPFPGGLLDILLRQDHITVHLRLRQHVLSAHLAQHKELQGRDQRVDFHR